MLPPNLGADFPVIVADPPWAFRDTGSRIAPSHEGTGRTYSHYDVMKTEDICAMGDEIKNIAADDCLLFLWAPHAFVLDGQAQCVALDWGFTPKQEIVWIKTTLAGDAVRFGGGHYARVCTEPMLLCRRGNAKVAVRNKPNVIFAPRTKHSAKPDDSYTYIEELTGADRYLELFARRRWSEKWAVWGSQIDMPLGRGSEVSGLT